MSPAARRPARLALALTATLAAVAAAPAAAPAATSWFGSSLNHEPANAGSRCVADDVTPLPSCTRVGSFYPGTSGRVKAPKSGRIVKIRLMAQFAGTVRIKVVRLRNVAGDHKSGQAKTIVRSRVLHLQGPAPEQVEVPIEEFTVNLPVRKGDSIAVDSKSNPAEYCSNGTPGQLLFRPVLAVGAPFRASTDYITCLLTVQAVVQSA